MDDRRALFIFFGILVGFKVWTTVLIFTLVTSWDTLAFLLATHVLWFAIGFAALWAPAIFWVRLVRARAKRRQLQRSEWNVEAPERTIR